MTSSEVFEFQSVFNDVFRVFPKRLDDIEKRQLGTDYFAAMRKYPLGAVIAGAQEWMQRGKFFPKPAEWIDAIPRRGQGNELVELEADVAKEYQAAEKNAWDGEPCKCGPCRAAGVDHRFLRYVPTEDRDGNTSKARIVERVVTRGHFIHGMELARWYAARDRFKEGFAAAVKQRTI